MDWVSGSAAVSCCRMAAAEAVSAFAAESGFGVSRRCGSLEEATDGVERGP